MAPVRKTDIEELYSQTQQAKGLLATLELFSPKTWAWKYRTTPKEHLRIVLLDVFAAVRAMDAVLNAPLKRRDDEVDPPSS